MNLLTVILVNYNTKDLTQQCIGSIYKFIPKTITYEIVLVDNASVDGSLEAINYKYPQVHTISNPKNLGFGAANNIGASYISNSKYILFLNTDAIIVSDIFTPIINLLEQDITLSAVTPFIVYPSLEPQTTYGKFPSIISFLFSFLKLKLLFRRYWNNRLSYYVDVKPDKILNVDHIVGVSMFVRKEYFDAINGFDTDYFLYFEETDLCYRLRKRGWKICVYPFVSVIHLLNKSMPSSIFKLKQMEQSRMLYFKKNSKSDITWKFVALIAMIKHTFWGIRHFALLSSLKKFWNSYRYVCKL